MSEVLYSIRGYRTPNSLIDRISEEAKRTGQSQNKTHEKVVIKGFRYDPDMAAKDTEIIRLRTELAKALWNAEAGHMNQWDDLGGDEKSELIARLKSTN